MAKNTDGNGSVYKRKGYKGWEGSVRLTHLNGTTSRPTRRGRTKTEVNARLAELVAQNELAKTGVKNLDEKCSRYFDRWVIRDRADVKAGTIEQRKANVKNWINPVIGDISISKVTGEEIDEIYSRQVKAGLTGTLLTTKSNLTSAFSLALKRKQIIKNPMHDAMWHPKRSAPKPIALEEDEFQKIASIPDQYQTFWQIMVGTGMRKGEAMGLQWDQVHLDKGYITVDKQLHKIKNVDTGKHSLEFDSTKTGNVRIVHINSDVVSAFRSHKAQQQLLLQPNQLQDNLVFPNSKGQRQDGLMYNKRLATVCKQVGIKTITLRTFRSTFGTWMAGRNVEMRTLHNWMGHTSAKTTMEYYIAPSQQTMKEQVSKTDGLFAVNS